MRIHLYHFLLAVVALLLTSSCQDNEPSVEKHQGESKTEIAPTFESISFFTADSVKVFGQFYETGNADDTILLFHQGGSNARAEYGPIIPRLKELGVNILLIDQMLGGQRYGSYNRTIADMSEEQLLRRYGYCDAYTNLEAAMDFLDRSGITGGRILWGSSYTASLVLRLASERPDKVLGVLSFSPAAGEVMQGCNPEDFLADVQVPLLILKPPSEMEGEKTELQIKLAKEHGHEFYAAENGVHGSSMLVQSRVRNDVSKNWEVVLNFIKKIRSKKT